MFLDRAAPAMATAVERETKSLRDTPLPKPKREQQKKQRPKEIVSSCDRGLWLTETFQRLGNLCRVSGKIDTINVARSRQIYRKFFVNASGMRGKKQDTISQARRFADVVRDKDDGFTTGFPNLLNVAVKLLASQGIKRGERFVHEQHAWIRRKRASQRDALLHSAGKLMNVCVFKPAQTDQLQIVLGDLVSVSI